MTVVYELRRQIEEVIRSFSGVLSGASATLTGTLSAAGVILLRNDGSYQLTMERTAATARQYGIGIDANGNFLLNDLTGGSQRLTLFVSGGIGIGATPTDPGVNNLQVQGALSAASAVISSAAAYLLQLTQPTVRSLSFGFGGGGRFVIDDTTGAAIRQLTIFANGGVAIGGNTDPGAFALSITGSLKLLDYGTATGAAGAATCNHVCGLITTESLTTNPGVVITYSVANSLVVASDIVHVFIRFTAGTGIPVISRVNAGLGLFVVFILNAGTVAFNNTLDFKFDIIHTS